MIIAVLLGLVSITSAISIWSDPTCLSLAFFEGEQRSSRIIPVTCLPYGSGADGWALLIFLFGLLPVGYGIFLLLDEFGGPDLAVRRPTVTPNGTERSTDNETSVNFETDGLPPSYVHCVACGSIQKAHWTICSRCSTTLSVRVESCYGCGANRGDGASFCSKCGIRFP